MPSPAPRHPAPPKKVRQFPTPAATRERAAPSSGPGWKLVSVLQARELHCWSHSSYLPYSPPCRWSSLQCLSSSGPGLGKMCPMLQAGSLAKALPHSRPQLCHLGWQRMIRARAQGLSVHRLLQWQRETHQRPFIPGSDAHGRWRSSRDF